MTPLRSLSLAHVLRSFACMLAFAFVLGRASPVRADAPAATAPPSGPTTTIVSLPVTPRVTRAAVHAAFRAARLLTDDTVDGLSSRARWTGLIPEVRLRATRLWGDTSRLDLTQESADTWRTSQTAGGNLWLEVRASFRLEKLLFADEELAALRLRLAQSEVAQRLAVRVVTELAAWQRAWVESKSAPAGSVAALESALRLSELEATLDALTGGWFSSWRGREVR